jgi:RimJ/RimL family protein N-acetyltransferase
MRFARFGITLQRLEPGDLEMVRRWRNSDWVRPYMRYRKVIGPDDQIKWFQNLDPERDWYFVARAGGVPFALFNIKEIDWSSLCGESGGFVGEPAFRGRPEPAQAALALMDFGFLVLHLATLQARYSPSLLRVVRFNQQLGYTVICEGDDGFLSAQVTAEHYLQCAASLRDAAVTMNGIEAVLTSADPWLLTRIRQSAATSLPDFHLAVR